MKVSHPEVWFWFYYVSLYWDFQSLCFKTEYSLVSQTPKVASVALYRFCPHSSTAVMLFFTIVSYHLYISRNCISLIMMYLHLDY